MTAGRSLKPQDRIAHYRIIGPLGSGGMGEVYCAQDQSLRRDVALKVLPPELVRSEERVRRFVREARSASSLNHPSIVTIYEIGHDRVVGADGVVEPDSSPLHFIAMELVSGETLAAKIHEQKTELKTLLGWLAQAAEGVSKAHAAGIVHRDLKPGNIMISQDGYAKVLDFGLAKLMDRPVAESALASASTQTAEPTSEGVVLGTVGYMAPEQVQGRDVDQRSDIFSFGCILYEATTRRRPFEAASKLETMHRILHDVPAPVEGLNPQAPAELRRLIRRCLAKDPNERLDSMRSLALELREIVEEYDQRTASAGSSSGPRTAAAPVPSRRRLAPAVIATSLAVAAIAVGFALRPKGPPRLNPDMRTRTIDVPMSGIRYPGFSQDGRWIALPARDDRGVWGLHFMNASGGEVRAIAVDSTVDVLYADTSPDGSQIAYGVIRSAAEAEIRLVSALGGTVRTLARPGFSPHWSPDGRRIGYIVPWPSVLRGSEFWTVRPDGSGRSLAFVDSTSESMVSIGFAWAPDGEHIAWLRSFAHASYNEIVIRDLQTGHERQLTHDHKAIDEVAWTAQDEILFSSNRGGATNLWIMRASGGQPAQVTRGAGLDTGAHVSADGQTLLYLATQPLASIGWWDVTTGEHGRVTHEDQPFEYPVPSPDGLQIAVRVRDPDALTSLVVMSRDGSGRRTLVAADESRTFFDWSPDGRRIAWVLSRTTGGDHTDLHVVDVRTGETSGPMAVPTEGVVGWLFWASDDTLLVWDQRGSTRCSVSEGRAVEHSPDMEFELPNRLSGWTTYWRPRESTVTPGIYVRPAHSGPERLVMPSGFFKPTDSDFLYCWPESLGFSRLDLPSGRLSPVAHVPPDVRRSMYLCPTHDGRVVFWVQPRDASKLVLVENFRK
ncbi:MAG: protein kinase [bacterium]